jgi:predicted GNAT family acetyltransferase
MGAAGRLARVALEQIRAEGFSVDPQCSYLADFIDKHPEYADLVA